MIIRHQTNEVRFCGFRVLPVGFVLLVLNRHGQLLCEGLELDVLSGVGGGGEDGLQEPMDCFW